ncbi:hybrid sensor histidine kinase/response regulator [Nitrosomonas supralitoralis]|uniref:histidine kinase n=1 Tax=Nitrosomonas supralitoralis TaxID=2116706 RepID=A0A2P7NQX1_9PROT|nr:ATP-binding protein [Nitrosomonas supralitoralis]PSJ15865.1 hybrid sensor histidine kinase/response regulator [Nitrosomonas supralitoralis]
MRRNTALELARFLGAMDLTIFIFDDDIQAYLPAPGFPQTLPDSREWKKFLDECKITGQSMAALSYVDFPESVVVMGVWEPQDNILALIGGAPDKDEVEEVRMLLPLLAAGFKGEQMVTNAKAKANIAQELASDAKILAESLDRARRDLGNALTEAKKAEDALKEADRRKDEFLATLAHELRNPLAPISNAIQLLKISGNKLEILENVRDIMERQVQQMVRLVDDLMDVSRITQGKIELRKEQVLLSEVIKNAIEIAEPLIKENQHTLKVNLPAEAIWLDADVTRIAQIFSNLLNNSAKYTECHGIIEISAMPVDGNVYVSIRDNGVGIPAEKLKHIFDMFEQIDSFMERSRGGLGIGLTLVKKLIEMHGGSIKAQSQGLGMGSEFTVCMPVVKIDLIDASQPLIDEQNAEQPQGLRILIVDDNVASAKTMMWMVEMLGHTAEIAHESKSAIELGKHFHPDIILLDIGLPGMNGYEICEIMRKEPCLQKTVFIAQTGWGQKEHLERSKAAGFDYHLVKPVDMMSLKNIISEFNSSGNSACK